MKRLIGRAYVWTVVVHQKGNRIRDRIFDGPDAEERARACFAYHKKRLDHVALLKTRRTTWVDRALEARVIWFRRQFHLLPLLLLLAGAAGWCSVLWRACR